jgi:hypothetical protein
MKNMLSEQKRFQLLKWGSYTLALLAVVIFIYAFPTLKMELGLTGSSEELKETSIHLTAISVTPDLTALPSEYATPFGNFYKNDEYNFALLYPDIYKLVNKSASKIELELNHDSQEHKKIIITINDSASYFQKIYDAHVGENTGDNITKLSNGTIAGMPTIEYLEATRSSSTNKDIYTLTRVINKNGTFISISATRNTKKRIEDFKKVLDYVTKHFNFLDPSYYTDTTNWQTFKSDEFQFKYPLNYTCTESTSDLDSILEGFTGYGVVCKDQFASEIRIGFTRNDTNHTLDTLSAKSDSDPYSKDAVIYRTQINGIEAVRTENMRDPRLKRPITKVAFLKDNYIYSISASGDQALTALDYFLNTVTLNRN